MKACSGTDNPDVHERVVIDLCGAYIQHFHWDCMTNYYSTLHAKSNGSLVGRRMGPFCKYDMSKCWNKNLLTRWTVLFQREIPYTLHQWTWRKIYSNFRNIYTLKFAFCVWRRLPTMLSLVVLALALGITPQKCVFRFHNTWKYCYQFSTISLL